MTLDTLREPPTEAQVKAAQEVFEEWFCNGLGLDLDAKESQTVIAKILDAAVAVDHGLASAYQRDFEKACQAVKIGADTFPRLAKMGPSGAISWLVYELAQRHEQFADQPDDEIVQSHARELARKLSIVTPQQIMASGKSRQRVFMDMLLEFVSDRCKASLAFDRLTRTTFSRLEAAILDGFEFDRTAPLGSEVRRWLENRNPVEAIGREFEKAERDADPRAVDVLGEALDNALREKGFRYVPADMVEEE